MSPVRLLTAWFLCCVAAFSASFVSFDVAPVNPGNDPFARELSFQIQQPDGSFRLQPAFYVGDGVWSVRLFPRMSGAYRLKGCYELDRAVEIEPKSPLVQEAKALPDQFVRIDPANPLRFVRGGTPHLPFGANLPWALGGMTAANYYKKTFPQFEAEGLNWARLWMAHWAGMNLDWAPDNVGKSPKPGDLDLQVAAAWDEIVRAAEQSGIAFQWVLQHHGQVSLSVNPNWDRNPWNAANPGGFLKTPQDFFTDAKARELTRRKYRYIVARWGYSPAVMAWELFNEVHNAESLRQWPAAVADVAAWHAEMGAYLRKIDPEKHLVTTSLDPIDSPVYSEMDYFQPHLYATEMIAASRTVRLHEVPRDRPLFFGEIGDDQLRPSAEDRANGESLIGPVWASVMSDAEQPGQTWYVERLIDSGRLSQLGSVARFLAASQFASRARTEPFEPRVQTAATKPYTIRAALWWQHHKPDVVELPLDGRAPARAAIIPKALVGRPGDTYPDRAILRFDAPQPLKAKVRLGGANTGGAKADLFVNGSLAASHDWPAPYPNGMSEPAELQVDLPAGPVELTLQNTGGREWFHFDELELSLPEPVVGAIGRRNEDCVLVWAWAKVPPAPGASAETAKIEVEALPAGKWRLRLWDTSAGVAISDDVRSHAGGSLFIETPPVKRHVAAILERIN